ncbi:homeobox protein Hox-C13a-like [Haemorhous mexicanus]|uniref:homeobox protein Hox-C13a-like n=1 Tax=Haemorhous mexicanus TaxID=30427 RepID=UPI0028BDBE5E|nr:homeobox protein Hox-C13a-like [Haemorhous mexicanus]
MTAPLGLPPRWPDALGCRCEDAPREKPRMESLGHCRESLGHCRESLGHCREMLPHAGLAAPGGGGGGGADGAAYAELASAEPARQCPSGSLGYGGYPFAPGYYGCRLAGVNLQQKPCGYHPPDKFAEAGGALAAEELPARAKEFSFYPGFPGSYQAVPGYLDVSVVPALAEPRHEALLPMEGYQPWALANGWDGQVYCSKEQPQPAHLWKAPFPGRSGSGNRERERERERCPPAAGVEPRASHGRQKSHLSRDIFHI